MKKIIIYTILFLTLLVSFGLFLTSTKNIFGVQSFVVLSGSMEPAVKTGSLVFTKPQSSYNIGDIISFNKGNQTVTHRIIKSISTPTGPAFITKGDANNVKDQDSVPLYAVLGKELFSVPYAGQFSLFLKTSPGFLLFIIFPALVFIVLEILSIRTEFKKDKPKKLQNET